MNVIRGHGKNTYCNHLTIVLLLGDKIYTCPASKSLNIDNFWFTSGCELTSINQVQMADQYKLYSNTNYKIRLKKLNLVISLYNNTSSIAQTSSLCHIRCKAPLNCGRLLFLYILSVRGECFSNVPNF